ncbi:uridylate kinase [Aliihoeflea sp. PC F10.4]
MAAKRDSVIRGLAAGLARLSLEHPVRVAVDGRTASGKTTLADELAIRVKEEGRPVIRTSIDGFHHPKSERYRRGRYSAEGYYYDARDLSAIRTLLLNPLGPGGARLYRTLSFDLENDQPVEQTPLLAAPDALLIVDGTFLQRPELHDGWDVVIFVAASQDVSEDRGCMRDAERLGGLEAARQLYAQRYRPAYNLYERLCLPERFADVILKNEDFDWPQLHVRKDGRLPDIYQGR